MAETAAGQNTEENNAVPPLLWDSQGRAEVAPLLCLSPGAKKELIAGRESLRLSPAWRVERGPCKL